MATAKQVGPLYRVVVDSVINGVKEAFLDDGVDEQVLLELKQLWENKLSASKAVEHTAEPDKRQTEQAARHLLRDQGCNTQQVKQGLVTQRAVLAAAPQQPASVSLSGNQSELAGAATQATITLPVGIFPQQLAALGVNAQGNITLQATPSGQVIAVQNIGGQPTAIAIPQQALISQRPVPTQQVAENSSGVHQLDGTGDGSSSSEDEDFDNDNDDNEEEQNDDDGDQGEEEEPLNSDDDISEEDPTELFDSENVVVCQYDKINRNKNKWKFTLKDGIMTLNGKDFVFQRAIGDAEW